MSRLSLSDISSLSPRSQLAFAVQCARRAFVRVGAGPLRELNGSCFPLLKMLSELDMATVSPFEEEMRPVFFNEYEHKHTYSLGSELDAWETVCALIGITPPSEKDKIANEIYRKEYSKVYNTAIKYQATDPVAKEDATRAARQARSDFVYSSDEYIAFAQTLLQREVGDDPQSAALAAVMSAAELIHVATYNKSRIERADMARAFAIRAATFMGIDPQIEIDSQERDFEILKTIESFPPHQAPALVPLTWAISSMPSPEGFAVVDRGSEKADEQAKELNQAAENRIQQVTSRLVWEGAIPLGATAAGVAGVLTATYGFSVMLPAMAVAFIAASIVARIAWPTC